MVLELVKLLEYCLYVLPIDEVRDLDPSKNVLVSFICLNDFIAWVVDRSWGSLVADELELYELYPREGSDPIELLTEPYLNPFKFIMIDVD